MNEIGRDEKEGEKRSPMKLVGGKGGNRKSSPIQLAMRMVLVLVHAKVQPRQEKKTIVFLRRLESKRK